MALSLKRIDKRGKNYVQGQKHQIVLQMGPPMIIFYFVLLLCCGMIAAFSENSSATTEGNIITLCIFHVSNLYQLRRQCDCGSYSSLKKYM